MNAAGLALQPANARSATVDAMVFDFRHKNDEGKWKASGICKGITRDAAFDALEQRNGGMPEGRYMSRPRDGHATDWDLFEWPREIPSRAQDPSSSSVS